MVTILELLGLLNKTSPALNNKKVLVDVMIPNDGGDSKPIYDCEITYTLSDCEIIYTLVDQDDNIVLVCRGNK